jgi:hypothetical protein
MVEAEGELVSRQNVLVSADFCHPLAKRKNLLLHSGNTIRPHTVAIQFTRRASNYMMNLRCCTSVSLLLPALFALMAVAPATAQQGDAKTIVASAVQTELISDRNDHTAFMYRDHDVTPEHDTLYLTVETPQGNLTRKLEDHGHPLNQQQRSADDQRIQNLIHDSGAVAKRKHDEAHDDDQAEQMLKLLPRAYVWSIAHQTPDLITLDFKPDPSFIPDSLEAKVLSAMAGQIQVTHDTHRISSIKGKLINDVTFGWGFFGRLRQGGSFEVQRREVAPAHWQMTENHTHIVGKALFFKQIGSEEDEVRSDFKVSHNQNIQQAWQIMQQQTP